MVRNFISALFFYRILLLWDQVKQLCVGNSEAFLWQSILFPPWLLLEVTSLSPALCAAGVPGSLQLVWDILSLVWSMELTVLQNMGG